MKIDYIGGLKNKPFIDVREFGALGDGSTDDTVAINTALSALNSVGGGVLQFSKGTYIISSSIILPGNNITIQGINRHQSTIMAKNSSSIPFLFSCNSGSNIVFTDIGFDGNFINQSYPASTKIGAIDATSTTNVHVKTCKFHAFGYTNTSYAGYGTIVAFYNNYDGFVEDCTFYSCFATEIVMNGSNGGRVDGCTFGAQNVLAAKTNINYWDTYSGGFGMFIANANNIAIVNNIMYGCQRGTGLTAYGAMVTINGSGGPHCNNVQIQHNKFYGLGNGMGTVSVSNGSGFISGSNTQFNSIDVGRKVMIEGDTTLYTITSWSSAAGVSVTPNVARANGSNLRFQYCNSGDVFGIYNVTDLIFNNNYVQYSGDNGADVAASSTDATGHCIISGNIFDTPQNDCLFLGGGVFNCIISGNIFRNPGQAKISGHRAGIELSPSNQGQTSPQNMWHMVITHNTFIDDQATATMTAVIQTDGGATSHIFSSSFAPTNHVYCLDGSAVLFSAGGITPGVSFNQLAIGGPIQFIGIPFANLGNLVSGIGGVLGGTYAGLVYCLDAKSVTDGAAIGSIAVGSGTGSMLQYINGNWRVM